MGKEMFNGINERVAKSERVDHWGCYTLYVDSDSVFCWVYVNVRRTIMDYLHDRRDFDPSCSCTKRRQQRRNAYHQFSFSYRMVVRLYLRIFFDQKQLWGCCPDELFGALSPRVRSFLYQIA